MKLGFVIFLGEYKDNGGFADFFGIAGRFFFVSNMIKNKVFDKHKKSTKNGSRFC